MAAILIAGCQAPSDRLAVSGEVILDGTPLDSGSIRFSGADKEAPVSTGAMIRDGHFDIPQDKGLPPGTYYLQISSPDTASDPVSTADAPQQRGIPVAQDRIPAAYNVNSDKTVEVTIDGDNHFVFDIPRAK